MYGMVNSAIEDLVVRNFGRHKWEAMCARAGVEVAVFISNEPYEDQVTYDLVAAAVVELGLSADAVLVAFGEHWVLETATKSYGPMMDGTGRSVAEVLQNLGALHTRVQMIMPQLRPPAFRVESVTDRSLILHYMTHRPGLTMFTVGLLQGLGKRFSTPVTVEVLQKKDDGADHDVFSVTWPPPP